MSEEVLFKVLIIGDALVGKTSFVQKYVHGHSRREYKPTIGGNEHSHPCICKYFNIHNISLDNI